MARKILIVDDDSYNLQLMHFILQKQGYELVQAQNGIEALEILRSDKPDLIIMDYMMPRLDGIELSQRLRLIPDLVNIPVLIVTAYEDGFAHIPVTALGVNAYLAKPITPRILVDRVGT